MPIASASAGRLVALAGNNFSAVTLQRGGRYAAEGRVHIKAVTEAPGQLHVTAEVQGTQTEPYAVDLWLGVDPRGEVDLVDGVCMCPVEEDCKHIVAVLMTLEKSGEIERGRRSSLAPRAAESFPAPSPATLDWLGELMAGSAPSPTAAESGVRVLYMLHLGDSPSLSIARSRPRPAPILMAPTMAPRAPGPQRRTIPTMSAPLTVEAYLAAQAPERAAALAAVCDVVRRHLAGLR